MIGSGNLIKTPKNSDEWARKDPKRDKNNFKEKRRQTKKNKKREQWDE